MVDLAQQWTSEVSRGPGWLFVRLQSPEEGAACTEQLGELIWDLAQCHLVRRVVLEMEDISLLDSTLIGQLVLLQNQISSHGGLLRLSGLSPANQQVLYSSRLNEQFPSYRTRDDAVCGRPSQPR